MDDDDALSLAMAEAEASGDLMAFADGLRELSPDARREAIRIYARHLIERGDTLQAQQPKRRGRPKGKAWPKRYPFSLSNWYAREHGLPIKPLRARGRPDAKAKAKFVGLREELRHFQRITGICTTSKAIRGLLSYLEHGRVDCSPDRMTRKDRRLFKEAYDGFKRYRLI